MNLCVLGWPVPTLNELGESAVLIGTPIELIQALNNIGGRGFLSALCAIILDEVDVLLPLPPKRTKNSTRQQEWQVVGQRAR